MTAKPTPAGPEAARKAALDALAAALDPRDFTATVVPDDGPVPYLTVSSRHAQLGEDVFADGQFYRWPWGQPIAAVGNPQAAATKVSHVLAAVPGSPGA